MYNLLASRPVYLHCSEYGGIFPHAFVDNQFLYLQVPMYIGETAPKHLRGTLGAMNQVLVFFLLKNSILSLVSCANIVRCSTIWDDYLTLLWVRDMF